MQASEIGAKLTTAGVNVKRVRRKEGGERVGAFYNPASKLATLRRSVVTNVEETMEEKLTRPLEDAERQEDARDRSDMMEDKEALDEHDSDDQTSEGDHEIDDRKRSRRAAARRDAEEKAKPKLDGLERQAVEKDEQGDNVALWTIDATATPAAGPTKLRRRRYDALGARPEEEDELEYALAPETPGRRLSFSLPDDVSLQSPSQRDRVVDSGHDPPESKDQQSIDSQPRLRRSSGGSEARASRISERKRRKRVAKSLHKRSPAKATRKRRSGEVVLKSNGALLKERRDQLKRRWQESALNSGRKRSELRTNP